MLSIVSGEFTVKQDHYQILLRLKPISDIPVTEFELRVPETNIYVPVFLGQLFQRKSEPETKGYVRVSTTMQTEHPSGGSLETQRQIIRNHCLESGLQLGKIYEDVASGKDMVRKGIKKMLNELHEGDVIICAELSRFSRDPESAVNILNEFKQKKVKLISLNPKLEVPSDLRQEALFEAYINVYKLERDRTSSQVSVNMERLSSEGKLRTKPPFGYKFISKDKDFVEVPEQIVVRDKIISLYRGGMKINHIAKKLNDEGDHKVLNPDRPNQKFYHETVKRILCDMKVIEPKGSLIGRKPIEERIISHHKIEQ